MESAKRDSILRVGIVSLAFAAVVLAFVPMAGAQAMGEYGAVVGNSAACRRVGSARGPSFAPWDLRPNQFIRHEHDGDQRGRLLS